MNKINIDLKLEDAYSSYNGKRGCMCGCRGKYYYVNQHKDYAEKDRGYKLDDDEINDIAVKKMFNKLINDENSIYDPNAKCLYLETETRNSVVFFK